MAARLLVMGGDARILERIRDGDEEGLVALYRTSRKPVTAYIVRNSGTTDDAEDVLQDALIILWERVRSGRFELTAKLDTFVVATVKNLWLRRLARKRREPPGPIDPELIPDGDPSPLDDLIDGEETDLLHDALDSLGDPCKTLLLLFYWEELPMGEIADRLGFANAETAKSKKYQCKKALESILKRAGKHRGI